MPAEVGMGAILASLTGSSRRTQQGRQRSIPMSGKFDRGAGTVSYAVSDEGILCAQLGGLLVPANAGELSALLLQAGTDRAATGVLCSAQNALVALPPINAQHYSYVPPQLRAVPVAVLVSPQQMGIYERIAQAAALAGTIRRAFLSRDEAQAWIREQARALAAQRVWWSAPRSLR
jgi:hypothetical protein